MNNNYRICNQCVMDTSDNYIVFDDNGVCNHCHNYDLVVTNNVIPKAQRQEKIAHLINKIKLSGKGNKYDCIAGLSGGMDSSYVIYLAKKLGLRTLIVHFDNGWDSELAIKNIENIINYTGFDYYNYIVDWEEFKDLQLSYFKASVVDVEIPTDMGIFSLIPKVAIKYNIKYIIYGTNIETETTMGTGWNYTKMDRANLEAIHRKYGTKELRTFPNYTSFDQLLFKIKGIKQVNILNYAETNYDEIAKVLYNEFKWKNYPVKHGESIFTKFYQSYYLPKKFGIDKRRAHLSDLINSGQKERQQALEILSKTVYSSLSEEEYEYKYVIRKLGLTEEQFTDIMERPINKHADFSTNQPVNNITDRVFLKIKDTKILTAILGKIYRIFS
ncbi:N-acetyl sugar amidotransferase [Spirosoma panaciterrae]|uniref:N-acetyl sugar amidotransferase n=1 Tax=Spirosoma panaciterrae TaxID=496058 RepID=UPI0003A4BC55|nr:N-acetyl sugar amidotransferase [Spirosoma panaciterrae]